MAVSYPSVLGWPAIQSDFLELYDWDKIVLNASSQANLSLQLDLCTGIFPCVMNVKGFNMGTILVSSNGSINCMASAGCLSVTVQSVAFVCLSPNLNSTFKFQGSALSVYDSNFSECSSFADGGIIFAYDMAVVNISFCLFQNIKTRGYGGVMKAAGSTISIEQSTFVNCTAASGGGALWATAYLCTGSDSILNTEVNITSSIFNLCSSFGSGGSILLTSDSSSLNNVFLGIQSSTFLQSISKLYGGAVEGAGATAMFSASDTDFVLCRAQESGGAISMQSQSQAELLKCIFRNNTAAGLGGGAIHAREAKMTLFGVTGTENAAPAGGGGMMFWERTTAPTVALWCPQGTWSTINKSCTIGSCALDCILCGPGTYQTGFGMIGPQSCMPCPAGTFSNLSASSDCTNCLSGTFATKLGAVDSDSCTKCSPGTYSVSLASVCSACAGGTYTNTSGSSVCLSCPSYFPFQNKLPASCNETASSLRSSVDQPKQCFDGRAIRRVLLSRAKRLEYRSFDEKNDFKNSRLFNQEIKQPILDSCDTTPSKSKTSTQYSTSKTSTQHSTKRVLGFNKLRYMSNVIRTHQGNRNSLDSLLQGLSVTLRSSANPDCQHEFTPACSILCGTGNIALYGPCAASDFNSFYLSHLPIGANAALAGLPVTITAAKKDAYNQTIASDSTSVVQVILDSIEFPEAPSFSLIGQSVFNMQFGELTFSLNIKPYFSNVSFDTQLATLREQPAFVLEGTDSESFANSVMQSNRFLVLIHTGGNVCPSGYVLTLDDRTQMQGPGECVFCKAGTYSLNPLASPPGSLTATPSCLNCPAGGNCIAGGSSVEFLIGSWERTKSMYLLRSCPIGYRLVNSTAGTSSGIFSHDSQECVACLPGQYIVPGGDVCQTCPAGNDESERNNNTRSQRCFR